MTRWTLDEIETLKESGPKLLISELAPLLPRHTPNAIKVKRCSMGAIYRQGSNQFVRFIPADPNNKVCPKCGIEKPKTEFFKSRANKDGLTSHCKVCHHAGCENRRRNHTPEERAHSNAVSNATRKLAKDRDVRLFKVRSMLSDARKRAKKRGIPFSITEADLGDWRKIVYCPVFTWIKLDWNHEGRCWSAASPSIDQVIVGLGYIPGNVRIISYRANRCKLDSSDDEIVALAEDVLSRMEQRKAA